MWYLALETASLNVVDRMEDQFKIQLLTLGIAEGSRLP